MATPLHNDRYGPLLSQHLKAILESGLLLDEDYEVLLNACNFKIYPTNSRRLPWGIIAGSLVAIGSTFVAWKRNKPVFGLPSLAAAVLLYFERRTLLKRKREQAIVSCVIKSLQKMRKLNTAIIRYLKMRKAGKSTKEDENFVSNENVREFVKFLLRRNAVYIKSLLDKTAQLASTMQEVADDFSVVRGIDVDSLISFDDEANDEVLVTRVHDVSSFLGSKYLNYLGLALNSHINNTYTLDILLNRDLPNMQKSLEQLHRDILKEFNNLKYNMAQKLEIDSIKESYFARQFSGRLQQTLMGAVNNLSIIMEKSRKVLGKVEEMEDNSDINKLEAALRDLRDHALATYESLDVLCRLYAVLSDATSRKAEKKIESKNEATSRDAVPIRISYEDEQEVLEEDFELFISEDEDIPPVQTTREKCDDQSGVYLSLMMKELRQALRQHDRFIEARKKRGIEDEEVPIRRPVQDVAKFDLSTFTKEKTVPIPPARPSKAAKSLEVARSSEEDLAPLPAPPPPPPPPVPLPRTTRPPPLPVFDPPESSGEEVSEGHSDSIKRTLFDDIKILSSQLKGQEEVFGDDCDSD